MVSLWANPQRLKDSRRLPELAGQLALDADVLQDKLNFYGDKQFMYLARHQTPDFARDVLRANFPGVRGEREYRRYYPAGEVTAQVLGLTNVDGRGIAGVELAYEEWLQGVPGKKRFIKDLHGEAVRDIGVVVEPRSGNALASQSGPAPAIRSAPGAAASNERNRRDSRVSGDHRCVDWRGARGE